MNKWNLTLVYLNLLFNPFKGLVYIGDYFQALGEIHLQGNVKLLQKIRLIQWILALKGAHYLYLGIDQTQSQLEMVLYFDALYLLLPRASFSLQGAIHIPMMIYLYENLFKRAHVNLILMLDKVLIREQSDFFLSSKYKHKDIVKYLQKVYYLIANTLNSLVFSNNGMLLMTHLVFAYLTYQNWTEIAATYNPLQLMAIFVSHHLSALGHWTFFYGLAQCITLNFSCLAILLLMFYIKIQQVHQLMAISIGQHTGGLTCQFYSKLRSKYILTVVFFLETNQMYGKMFLGVLSAFLPCNIIQAMWITNGFATGFTALFVGSFIYYHMLIEFTLHYALAQCSKHIHKPAKLLVNLMVKGSLSRKKNSIRSRIQLATDIGAWYTDKLYGFTYGKFGLVSMAAFTKYILLYGKFIMLSYKMIQQKNFV